MRFVVRAHAGTQCRCLMGAFAIRRVTPGEGQGPIPLAIASARTWVPAFTG